MYSCGITPPLLNGSFEPETITPQTCPSGWTTAYPPKPFVFTGAGVDEAEGVGDGVGDETGVELSTEGAGVGVLATVELSITDPAGTGTGFAQTPPDAVDTPFA
jgi:hypothetical protein